MPAMRAFLAVFVVACLAAAEVPPSPADVPGVRIWPQPAFSHWPAVAYGDETRNAAVAIPVRKPGARAELGWEGVKPTPIVLPADAERTSALVDLMLDAGVRRLRLSLPEGELFLPIRTVPAGEAWPLARLVDGFPVDANGVPVVLVDERHEPSAEAKWKLLKSSLPRPTGRALIVGDALESMGDSAWTGLDAEARPAVDQSRPHHACLVALAALPQPLPRTVIWCPGNGAIRRGDVDPEEIRLMGAVKTRFTALKMMPLLFIALPPRPVEERLQRAHDERREQLLSEADRCGWKAIDLARAAGDPASVNRVGDNTFTTYPTGAALVREREALAAALVK